MLAHAYHIGATPICWQLQLQRHGRGQLVLCAQQGGRRLTTTGGCGV